MKSSTVMILAVGAFAYLFLSQQRPQVVYPTGTVNPTGGVQQGAPQDLFTSILGTVSAIAGAVGSIAQTQSKTT